MYNQMQVDTMESLCIQINRCCTRRTRSTVESLNTFNEFENALESIVAEEENGLFSSDKEESNQALEKLNKLMAKHFPRTQMA